VRKAFKSHNLSGVRCHSPLSGLTTVGEFIKGMASQPLTIS